MWTLRDIWHLFDEEARQRWLQQQAKRLSMGRPDTQMGLLDMLQNKHQQINTSPSLDDSNSTPQQEYGRGMDEGWYRLKYPPKYKGMI